LFRSLLSRASALKNVMLPMLYSASRLFTAKKRARRALERVGLGDRMSHRPNQLSGGQRQRVAVARALVNDPAILLADEPTGNLDSTTTIEIIQLFKELHDAGQTIIIVTHEEDVAGHAQRIVRLRDGKVVSDNPTGDDPIHRDWLRTMAEGHTTHFDARPAGSHDDESTNVISKTLEDAPGESGAHGGTNGHANGHASGEVTPKPSPEQEGAAR
ncbi:MAG: ABC transporter ATP-binding protein, partial [Phycisphaerales bacterium JB040]